MSGDGERARWVGVGGDGSNFSNDFCVVCGFWLELDIVLRLSYRTFSEMVGVAVADGGGDGCCYCCS